MIKDNNATGELYYIWNKVTVAYFEVLFSYSLKKNQGTSALTACIPTQTWTTWHNGNNKICPLCNMELSTEDNKLIALFHLLYVAFQSCISFMPFVTLS